MSHPQFCIPPPLSVGAWRYWTGAMLSLAGVSGATRLYGLGEAVGDAVGKGEAVGDAVGKGEAVGDGEARRSVVSSALEGTGVVVVVGSVRWGVVCSGGSYGPLSATDIVIATTTAISVTSGASATTSGKRTNGRTHPSKTYHNSTAKTTVSTAATSHPGSPNIRASYPPNILRHHGRSVAVCGPPVSGTGPRPCCSSAAISGDSAGSCAAPTSVCGPTRPGCSVAVSGGPGGS
jgi:hypothetical protein